MPTLEGVEGRVDYRIAAAVYEQGRALPAGDLDRWHAAITRFAPAEPATVLDLGAGTGIFARAWSNWGARIVVGCEPSAEMREQARRLELPRRVAFIAGRAEQIPLETGSTDVVWMSTVVHHLADLPAAAGEIRRVLKPGGLLLIRNLFADVGTTPWLSVLPGADRARRVFPAVRELSVVLDDHGLDLVEALEVAEHYRNRTAHAAAAWIRLMRNADSLLLAFTDSEIAAGLQQLDSCPTDHRLGPSRIGLAVFHANA